MPQRHQPESLEKLALKAVGSWTKIVGRGIIDPVNRMSQRDSQTGKLLLDIVVAEIQQKLFANVFCYMYDSIAVQVLISIKELIDEIKSSFDNQYPTTVFLGRMKIATLFTEVAMHSQLKEFSVWEWPKIMRHVLIQNLSKLKGLENLNLGSASGGWDTTEMEKNILPAVSCMPNLTKFCLCYDCTNSIVNTLGKCCPALQSLDIMSSRSVTNSGLTALFNCKKLRELNLFRTSVTVKGFTELLQNLPNLQNIGRCDDFGNVLERLKEQECKPLSITAVQCKDISIEQLKLLVYYCPNLRSVSMLHYARTADLTILKELQCLRDLKLLNCEFYSDLVKQLLECKGDNLEYLNFEHVDEIDLNALIYISRFCPKLKTLMFHNCEFSDHHHLHFDLTRLGFTPFDCLETLVCVSDCSLIQLEFLLKHCKNVKSIQLGSCTGINDATVASVMRKNPLRYLEELKILRSSDLSMASLNLFMEHCDRLRRISTLEGWGQISQSELQDFRDYIRSNNIIMDTTTVD